MKKKKKNRTTILLVVLLLAGLSLLLYPTVSDYWNSFHQTRAIASYAETVAELDNTQYDALWDAARRYNEALPLLAVLLVILLALPKKPKSHGGDDHEAE